MKKFIVLTIIVLISVLVFTGFKDRDFQLIKNLDIYYTLFRELNMYYVDETDPEELIEKSIEGMLNSLDPYTTYISEKDLDNFTFMTTGEYGGIGALIRPGDEHAIISDPYAGFPAAKSGLKAGDIILSIDGVKTKEKTLSGVSDLLKGKPGTLVDIKIKRPFIEDSIATYSIEREKITISNVPYAGMLTDEIGYIRLMNFTSNAGKEVKDELQQLKDKGAEKIILDLRSNPGGLLMEAVNVSNIFIENGEEIVSTRGKVEQWDATYKTTKPAVDNEIPLVVLVSRGSASASEIVAGSMQDLDRAVIVGQRTFGKGLVQTTRPLSYNAQLKVTTAKYYIPSGRCIQALDYAHRNEDGSVGNIPDSLISEFKTRNGRTVYDGGGIKPDVTVDPESFSNISLSLYTKNFIFNFATLYTATHPEPLMLDSFSISDEIYTGFVDFLQGKDFDYQTSSESKLDELIKIAKREKYFTIAENEFAALREKIAHDKDKDLQTFSNEIKQLLLEEIAGRYYYQKGKIRASLRHDNQLATAIEIIKDAQRYNKILTVQNHQKSTTE